VSEIIFYSWVRIPLKCQQEWRENTLTSFFFPDGGVKLQNWLASDLPGAYTSMPQTLLFGAKDVC